MQDPLFSAGIREKLQQASHRMELRLLTGGEEDKPAGPEEHAFFDKHFATIDKDKDGLLKAEEEARLKGDAEEPLLPKAAVITLGNPGRGKSMILNRIAGKGIFPAGLPPIGGKRIHSIDAEERLLGWHGSSRHQGSSRLYSFRFPAVDSGNFGGWWFV